MQSEDENYVTNVVASWLNADTGHGRGTYQVVMRVSIWNSPCDTGRGRYLDRYLIMHAQDVQCLVPLLLEGAVSSYQTSYQRSQHPTIPS